MLEKVYRFFRKDIVIFCPGRNPPFQALNRARFHLGPKVLGESTTAFSYCGGIFLGHPEPVVSGMTIFLNAIPLKMGQSNNELRSSVPFFGCLKIKFYRIAQPRHIWSHHAARQAIAFVEQ